MTTELKTITTIVARGVTDVLRRKAAGEPRLSAASLRHISKQAGLMAKHSGSATAGLDMVQGIFDAVQYSGIDLTHCRDRTEVMARVMAYLVAGKRVLEPGEQRVANENIESN